MNRAPRTLGDSGLAVDSKSTRMNSFRISRETIFVVSLARCRWPVRPSSGGSTIASSNSLLACKPVTMKHSDATEDVIMIKRPLFPRPCSFPSLRRLTCLAVVTAFLTIANGAVAQQRYNTPDAAVTALVGAVRVGTPALLMRVLGPGSDEVVSSGDPVADAFARKRLLD